MAECPGSRTENGRLHPDPRLMTCNVCDAAVPYSVGVGWWEYAKMRPHSAEHSDGADDER